MVVDVGAVVVGTRDVFSEQELARLRGFPEITRAELIKYFTLTGADEVFFYASSAASGMCWARVCSCARCRGGAVALRGVGAAEIVNRGWSDHQGQLVEGSQDP